VAAQINLNTPAVFTGFEKRHYHSKPHNAPRCGNRRHACGTLANESERDHGQRNGTGVAKRHDKREHRTTTVTY